MEENLQVRAAPNTNGNRNGMPPAGGYVYRGWYIDIMPWADSGDGSTDYDTGLERRHEHREMNSRCKQCNHDYRSRHHREHCR
jgi:hypothetical protein